MHVQRILLTAPTGLNQHTGQSLHLNLFCCFRYQELRLRKVRPWDQLFFSHSIDNSDPVARSTSLR